jgi:hypothetical protein
MTMRVVPALALALAGMLAHADGDYMSPTNERVRLSLGIVRESASTDVQVDDAAGNPGTEFNAEDALGLDRARIEPKFQAMVRVEERHRLFFDYFALDRSDTQTLGQPPIAFGNVILQSGSAVQTTLNLSAFGVTYGYSFLHSESFELAGTFGLEVTDISIQARQQTPAYNVDQREDEAGPFPVLGLAATWVVSERFYFDARGQYLNVAVNHLQGSLGIYEIAGLYRFRPNVSFALGYSAVRASLSSTQATKAGYFDFDAKGPELFVRVAF